MKDDYRRFALYASGMVALSVIPAEAKTPDLLAVVNKSDSSLSLMDIASGRARAVVPTGKGPHEVVASPDGKYLFVSDYVGVPGDRGHTLTVIDVAGGKPSGTVELLPNRAPHGLAISRDGKWLWATCEVTRTIAKVDVNSRKLVNSIATGDAGTHMLALAEPTHKAYATSIDKGMVVVIDLSGEKDIKHVATGPGAEGITVTEDGKYVLVTNRQAGTLSAIDTSKDEVVKTIEVGKFPIRVKTIPSKPMALVTNMEGNEIVEVDTVRWTVTRRLGVGDKPVGVALYPRGDFAVVANTAANKLTLIDLKSWKRLRDIDAGKEPDGMAYVMSK